jgi:TRAP-type C4-dicarboxylate transport system permease small subunit
MEQVVENPQPAAKQSSFMRVITRISQVMAAIGAIMFGIMMMITVIDVTGRKFFLHPLNGAVELVGFSLILGATWGMGYCELLGMNIRINVISDKLPRRYRGILGILTYLISAGVCGLIAWRAYVKVESYFTNVMGSVTDVLSLPFWPIVMMMGIGLTWAGFIFIVQLYKSISEVTKR